jgi:hypothetical protein
VFAETSGTSLGISNTELNRIVTEYLEDTFKKYLRQDNLHVTELSCTTDWNPSAADKNLSYFNVQARFRNFPINSRFLTGRLETRVAVRKTSFFGIEGKPRIHDKDQKDRNITLLVDDQLSDELRDAMVRNYITKNYEHPLDINIYKERMEVYSDKIYSYVSGVVNNDSIVYLRAVFEKKPTKTEKVDIFTILETPWELNRAEQIFLEKFPDKNRYKKDIAKDIFDPMEGYYRKTIGGKTLLRGGSKIESITSINLEEANAGTIKLKLKIEYLLDSMGLIGSFKRYTIILNVYYGFNFEDQKWEYKGIEELDEKNINARR